MPDEPKGGLARRDFMIASLATVGASVALAASSKDVNAQEPAASPADPATQGTVYIGDVIQGKKVISALDVNDLEPGRKHAFYFQGVQMPTGQHWYVSVMVAKGAKPGKRVALVSGVHGDEMSPVHTIQTVMNQLDPAEMSGTVLAVFDVSRPAMEGMSRRWPNSGRGIDLIDINREWPGNENGAGAPSPTRRAPVQQALQVKRRLRDRFPYLGDRHGHDGVPSCPDGPAGGPGDGGVVSHRSDLRQSCLSRSPGERVHRRGHPGVHARDRRPAHAGPRDDPACSWKAR